MWKVYIKQYHYSLISAIFFNRDSASTVVLPNASKGNSTTIQQCTRTRATDCATFHSICSIIYIKKKLLSQQQRPAPAHYIFWNCTFCRPPLEYSKPRMSAIFNKNTLLIAHFKNYIIQVCLTLGWSSVVFALCLLIEKKVMTYYSDPMVTYSHPKMTYSYPKVT